MKTQTKSALVLIVTLLVGVAIGAVGWSIVHNERMERMREMRREGGLYGVIDRYIDPESAGQEERLRAVADRYHRQLEDIYGLARSQRNVALDSMRAELSTMLSPVQQEAMAEWLRPRSEPSDSTQTPN